MTNFNYTVHDDHIEITSYTGSASSVTNHLPEKGVGHVNSQ